VVLESSLSDFWDLALANTFTPSDQGQLAVCFLFWVGLFLVVNVGWDIGTPKTPKFHIARMKDKVSVVYDGAFVRAS
jgi:hypothetical protein